MSLSILIVIRRNVDFLVPLFCETTIMAPIMLNSPYFCAIFVLSTIPVCHTRSCPQLPHCVYYSPHYGLNFIPYKAKQCIWLVQHTPSSSPSPPIHTRSLRHCGLQKTPSSSWCAGSCLVDLPFCVSLCFSSCHFTTLLSTSTSL